MRVSSGQLLSEGRFRAFAFVADGVAGFAEAGFVGVAGTAAAFMALYAAACSLNRVTAAGSLGSNCSRSFCRF